MWMLALISLAFAKTSPLVVRLNTAGADLALPLVVKVTATDGSSVDVNLLDDGERPDIAAQDGRWAGVGVLEGATLTLTLSAGGAAVGTTTLTLEADSGPRDLDLSLGAGGALTATGTVPTGTDGSNPATPAAGGEAAGGGAPGGDAGAGVGAGAGGGPTAGGGGGPGGGDPAARGGSRPSGVTFPTEQSDDGLLFIGFGVGLLALLGVGWLWMRSRRRGAGRPSEVSLVPEPGLLGPGTPSLSDGLSLWIAPDDVAPGFLQPLLAALADRHRVLVVARSEVLVRPVQGGPVFRLTGMRPSLVGDVAEQLAQQDGPPLAVLLVLDNADTGALRDYTDLLPSEVGGVALLRQDAETSLPKVFVTAVGQSGQWDLGVGDTTVRTRAGAYGLEVVQPAA